MTVRFDELTTDEQLEARDRLDAELEHRQPPTDPLARSVSVRSAIAFGDWPPAESAELAGAVAVAALAARIDSRSELVKVIGGVAHGHVRGQYRTLCGLSVELAARRRAYQVCPHCEGALRPSPSWHRKLVEAAAQAVRT